MPDSASIRPLAADDSATLDTVAQARTRLEGQLRQRIIGQDRVLDLLLTCLFAGGHGLFVGVPGLAKTLIVSSLAEALALKFSRIQFTPDLMPADITGIDVLEEDPETGRRRFRFVEGPVFCNLLLADEVNRTPPKTQAALLQAMQERRVSAGGHTHTLDAPFHVFATQNPIEQEGTYPLPEAQLDRFMMQIRVDYPDELAEREIVTLGVTSPEALEPVLDPAMLVQLQTFVRRVPIPPSVVEFAVALLRATRPENPSAPPIVREFLRFGAGPRAGQQLLLAAQAHAACHGDSAVTMAHIKSLATAVLDHRLVRGFAAESRGVSTTEIVESVLGHLG